MYTIYIYEYIYEYMYEYIYSRREEMIVIVMFVSEYVYVCERGRGDITEI